MLRKFESDKQYLKSMGVSEINEGQDPVFLQGGEMDFSQERSLISLYLLEHVEMNAFRITRFCHLHLDPNGEIEAMASASQNSRLLDKKNLTFNWRQQRPWEFQSFMRSSGKKIPK